MKLDIIIRNGHVIDPQRNIDRIMSIGICGNKIMDIENQDSITASRTIDASNCFVFPGLIDFHTHLNFNGSSLGTPPDSMMASGVTAAVDAGSTGCLNFPIFCKSTIANSMLRVKAYLSCYSLGIGGGKFVENFNPDFFNEKSIAIMLEKYSDVLLGLKIRLSIPLAEDVRPLKKLVEIAEKYNTSVCVHTTNPPCSTEEIANTLRKDDIFCHVYHGKGATIFDDNGKIFSEVLEARSRGVVFDAAHGNNHFSNEICIKALEQGFMPDIISTDMTGDKMFYGLRARSLPFVMSKFLSFGMPLNEVIKCVTETPAKFMKMKDKIGTLKPGAYADVSIFKIEDREFPSIDYTGSRYTCKKMFIPQMTIIDGNIIFGQMDFSLEQ